MIGVIGVSYHRASLEIREKIIRAFSKLMQEENDCIFLSTCHRAEWYFSSQNPAKTHEAITLYLRLEAGDDIPKYLFSFFGEECVYHLEKVISGLDSLFLGETEIQGQVKTAYEKARTSFLLPKELHTLFQKALHTGKALRNIMGEQTLFLQNEVVQRVLESKAKEALLIGTSVINRKISSLLSHKGIQITFVNRTEEKAHICAKACQGQVIPWADLQTLWATFPCVIAATRSPSYFLCAQENTTANRLLIDLGVPRNIDPALGKTHTLLNIESFSPTCLTNKYSPLENVLSKRAKTDFIKIVSH